MKKLINKAVEIGYDNPIMFNTSNEEDYSYWLYGLQKYIRDDFRINIDVMFRTYKMYTFVIYNNPNRIMKDFGNYSSYEEALEEGLKEGLKLI